MTTAQASDVVYPARSGWRVDIGACAVSHKRVLIVISALIVLYAPGISWGLPSEYPMATNAEAPYDSLLFVGAYTNAHQVTKYPDVSPLLALAPYAAIIGVAKLAGGLTSLSAAWPYGFADPDAVFSTMLLARNLMSLAMGIGALVTLSRLRLRSMTSVGRYTSIALLATSGVFVYYSRVPTEDIPYILWWTLSLVFLVAYLYASGRGLRDLLLSGVFSALAVGTKDQAAGLVVGSGVLVLLLGHSRNQFGRRLPLAIKEAAQFSAAMLATYVLVAILPQPWRWFEHIKVWLPSAPNVADYVMFPSTAAGQLGLLGATVHTLVDDLSVGTLVFAVIGLGYLVRTRLWTDLLVLIVPAAVYYLTIIAPIRFVYERFMLPVAYLTVIAAGVGVWALFSFLKDYRSGIRWLAPASAALVVAFQFGSGYLPVTAIQLIDAKRQLAEQAPAVIPPGSTVLFMTTAAMRGLPNSNFYHAYQMMLPEDAATPARYAHIFHPFDASYQFVLTINPLEDPSASLRLVKSISLPPEFVDRAAVPITQNYYIYQRS